jgi:hypothetical protein
VSEQTTEKSEPGVSDVLGEHAANPPRAREDGTVIFSLGQEHLVSPGEQRFKAQFEQWLKRNAMIHLKELRESGYDAEDPEGFRTMEESVLASIAGGKYNWGGAAWRSAMKDLPGLQYFFFLLYRRCNPDATEDLARKVWFGNPGHCSYAVRVALGNLGTLAKLPGTNGAADGRPKKAAEEPTLDG